MACSWSTQMLIVLVHCGHTQDHIKPTVRVEPQSSVYTGDTVTLTCELPPPPDWTIYWKKDSQYINPPQNTYNITVSDPGEYQCGALRGDVYTEYSDPVRITVGDVAQAVLSVSPQSWLTEGDSVTLSCEVTGSSTGWTFSWYRAVPYRQGLKQIRDAHGNVMYGVELLSDSRREAGGSYSLSPAALHPTGVYVCRAERGEPAYQTQYSSPQPLWITVFSMVLLSPTDESLSPSTGNQQTANQSQNLSGSGASLSGTTPLQADDAAPQASAPIYAQVTKKKQKGNVKGLWEKNENEEGLCSLIEVEAELSNVTYAEIDLKPRKDLKNKHDWNPLLTGKTTAGTDTVYSELKQNTDTGIFREYNCFYTERPTATVKVQPADHVLMGERVTLTCEIESGDDWNYEWYKNNNLLSDAKRKEYEISNVGQDHAGVYTCSGSTGVTVGMVVGLSLTVFLIIILGLVCYYKKKKGVYFVGTIKPTMRVEPQSSVYTGDTVTLTCELPPPATWTIYWKKDSAYIFPSQNTYRITVSDPGEYQCGAGRGDVYTEYSDPVRITVRERPKATVKVQPADHVLVGERVTLTCEIESGDYWNYEWYKNNNPLNAAKRKEYEISNVGQYHAGVYTCKGTQSTGRLYTHTSAAVTLTVSVKCVVGYSRLKEFKLAMVF
ncbi:hypothetical protein NFI96_010454 [Prochilodus magdalenae]|nr:hypothetical protein NFI96_010454 [Prochilodus magdalenae]